jgi:hypothetical protein
MTKLKSMGFSSEKNLPFSRNNHLHSIDESPLELTRPDKDIDEQKTQIMPLSSTNKNLPKMVSRKVAQFFLPSQLAPSKPLDFGPFVTEKNTSDSGPKLNLQLARGS